MRREGRQGENPSWKRRRCGVRGEAYLLALAVAIQPRAVQEVGLAHGRRAADDILVQLVLWVSGEGQWAQDESDPGDKIILEKPQLQ